MDTELTSMGSSDGNQRGHTFLKSLISRFRRLGALGLSFPVCKVSEVLRPSYGVVMGRQCKSNTYRSSLAGDGTGGAEGGAAGTQWALPGCSPATR